MKEKNKLKQLLLMLVVITVMFSTYPSRSAYAAVPSLDQIRVALFLNIPNQSLSQTKVATISSESMMKLRVGSVVKNTEWLTFNANTTLRFNVNDFKVKLYESTNFEDAKKVFAAAKTAGGTPFLISLSKNNKPTYQVLEGGYNTVADANNAMTKWKGNKALASLLTLNAMTTIGSVAYETGSFTTRAAAQATAASYGALGLDTALGMKLDSTGKLVYAVQIGFTATAKELEALKAIVDKVAGAVNQVDNTSETIVLRSEHGVTGAANQSHDLYSYNPGLKVYLASANSDGTVTVAERSNRKYRGTIELGVHNQAMYVINELPFEQYLYSVVAIEMYTSWPMEALKSQAVAARTYALYLGNRFEIANVVDTTLSQVYYGASAEHPNTTAAVDATKGEVVLYNGAPIETLYSSNAGGLTADAAEAWGNPVPYLKSVSSPDEIAQEGLFYWYRVVTTSGVVGYVREDVVTNTGSKNEAGKPILSANSNETNIRKNPIVETEVAAIAQVNQGAQLVALEKVIQTNAMTWRRGPYTGDDLLKQINSKLTNKINGPLNTITIAGTGESGRVTKLSVNGVDVSLKSPVEFRGVLGIGGSLPSTQFTIEATGNVVILGSGQDTRTKTDGTNALQVIGSNDKITTANSEYLFIMDGSGEVRAATKGASYQIEGTGNGHGVGLSQYGAYSLARQGYDYEYILKYYYTGVTIAKD